MGKLKIRPAKLTHGDTVGVIALSSPLKMEQLPIKLELLERLGLRYQLGQTIAQFDGFLAGNDEERLADLHAMIADKNIKAIFCVRGGYGIGRLLDKMDYQLLQENPKIIWGFSDVTSLHIAVNQYADLVTFHGPMLSESSQPLDELSEKMFQQLFTPMEIHYDEGISKLETIVGGVARGELIGGNLNRLVSTLATKFEVDLQDKIVVLEDIHESPDRIDGMLNQLRLARKLEQARGFVIGDFNGVEEAELLKIILHYLKPLNKPVVAGFKIGHCQPNIGLPLGVEAILDADEKVLRILPGVE